MAAAGAPGQSLTEIVGLDKEWPKAMECWVAMTI